VTESDQTIALLRDIRDQMVATRVELKAEIGATRSELKAEIAATNKRLDDTNTRLDDTNTRLESGFAAVNERLAIVETTVCDCAQQLVMLGRYVKNGYERLDAGVTKLENP
jgi:hypothetical protein